MHGAAKHNQSVQLNDKKKCINQSACCLFLKDDNIKPAQLQSVLIIFEHRTACSFPKFVFFSVAYSHERCFLLYSLCGTCVIMPYTCTCVYMYDESVGSNGVCVAV